MASVVEKTSKPARPSSGLESNITEPTELADLAESSLAEPPVKRRKVDHSKPTASERKRRDNLSYYAIIWLAAAHLVCLAAPFYFSWSGLIVMVVLHWVTGSLGICLGYHRLLTHSGMKTYPWVRTFFAYVGTLAGQGSPLDWIADHRKHHAYSDHDGDPHSPRDGGWWSHIFWLAYHSHNGERKDYLMRWAPDLYKDPAMRLVDKMFLPVHFISGVLLFGIGCAVDGVDFGVSLLIWGLFLRLVGVLHATWMVNSASHIWGYKNYDTVDDSRNNWLVAIVAYGEGWHNNHHAYPRMAKHGHKWWEFDITWMAIKLLKSVGLVWDVVDYRTVAEKKAKEAQAAS